jgi:hypothetical protein
MALRSCYECNKEISTKAIMCPQCGAPQNPVSGLVDKVKDGFIGKTFNKVKNNIRENERKKEIARDNEIARIIETYLEHWVNTDETLRDDDTQWFTSEKKSTKSMVERGLLDDSDTTDKIISDFMDEMGIERTDNDGNESPWKKEIFSRLFWMRNLSPFNKKSY